MVNRFSQITDKIYYSSSNVNTWYVTDDAIPESLSSYTKEVEYTGLIDTTLTRYGPNGISYYVVETETEGLCTASVHPLVYTTVDTEIEREVVTTTTVDNRIAVINMVKIADYVTMSRNVTNYGRFEYGYVTLTENYKVYQGDVSISSLSNYDIITMKDEILYGDLSHTMTSYTKDAFGVEYGTSTSSYIYEIPTYGGGVMNEVPTHVTIERLFRTLTLKYQVSDTVESTFRIIPTNYDSFSVEIIGLTTTTKTFYTTSGSYISYTGQYNTETVNTLKVYQTSTNTTTSFVEPKQLSSLI